MARLLPLRCADPFQRGRPGIRRRSLCRGMPQGGCPSAAEYRKKRMGRRVVPPGVLRRRHTPRVCLKRGVQNRLHCPELVCPLRSRGCAAVPYRHGIAEGTSRPKGGRAYPASRPPLRQILPQPRLHQGVRSGGAGERRSVYPQRHLGDHGLCRPRGLRNDLGALLPDQSCESRPYPRGGLSLQGRTLCHGCGRLRCASPYREGRVDMVHRFVRMDVPPARGIHPRTGAPGKDAPSVPLRSGGVEEFPVRLPLRRRGLPRGSPSDRRRGIADEG